MQCGEQPQLDSKAASEVMDTLKGAALVIALLAACEPRLRPVGVSVGRDAKP
jgi:hypothetical protein